MQDLWKIYHHDIPWFLLDFMQLEEMQRLKDVGMNCGVEYTSFPIFKNCRYYSRFDHSVGVALIIWHFTADMKQTIAGLLHDIATPVFAHTIDFLNHDYTKQESTEEETADIIRNSKQLNSLLHRYHLNINDVIDYHQYPIADNDMPQLSADRLEYSLGNMYNYGFVQIEEIKKYYDHIYINSRKDELVFDDLNIAVEFTGHVFENSYVYISDEDRFAMESLARILKDAIAKHVIDRMDLNATESYVIARLKADPEFSKRWDRYCQYHQIISCSKGQGLCIPAKKRYILPLYHDKRISQHDHSLQVMLDDFLAVSFEKEILAK